ncbi:hypothetical protein C8R46DRAFT_1037140 [Mycena filopes]|nr:hypothetical protein C8R46DRAFT_1037140 [Mycena filopes]
MSALLTLAGLLALAALLALFIAVPTRRPSRRKPVRHACRLPRPPTHNPVQRPPRLRRFVERLKQLARRCVVRFKQAVLVPHDSLRRPPRLRRFLGRLKQLARRCVVRLKQAIRLVPTSRSLLGLDANEQIEAHLKHRDLYASEGTGLVYVCAAVRKRSLAAFRAGKRSSPSCLSKSGRKKGYSRCNKNGQTHLWLWCFRVQRRCVGERLCHLFGNRIAPRTGLQVCTGCTGTHRDYLQLSAMGFDNLMATMKDVFAQLGEPDLVPIKLEHMNIAGLFLERIVEYNVFSNERGKGNATGTYCTDSTPTGISHVHITEYKPPALRPCARTTRQTNYDNKAHGGSLEWGWERSYVGPSDSKRVAKQSLSGAVSHKAKGVLSALLIPLLRVDLSGTVSVATNKDTINKRRDRETGEFFETDPYALGRAQEGVAQLLNRMSDVDDECDLLREQIRARGEELAKVSATSAQLSTDLLNVDPTRPRKHAVSKSDQTLQSAAMDVDGDKVSDPGQTENAPSSPRIANASALAEWLKQHPDSPEASGHAAMLTLVPRYDGRHKPKRQRRKATFLAVLSLLIVPGQYAALLKKKRLQIASVAISSLPVETLDTRILAIAQHLAAKGVTIALADDCGQYCRMFAEAEVRGGSPQFFPDMLKELLFQAREVCKPTLLPYT